MKTVISEIANVCQWHKIVNESYMDVCTDKLDKLHELLPHGSGFDTFMQIDVEKSGIKKVVINTEYHVLNENGYYTGYIQYHIIITPLFDDIKINVRGKYANGIKDYVHECMYMALTENIE